jgi:hypothetical protein
MREMVVSGKLNEYKVSIENAGWSWALPVIRIRKRILFLPISRWVKVWEGAARSRISADKMYPSVIEDWCKLAVEEYEGYVIAWNDHKPCE